jgi:hypothetical protein
MSWPAPETVLQPVSATDINAAKQKIHFFHMVSLSVISGSTEMSHLSAA